MCTQTKDLNVASTHFLPQTPLASRAFAKLQVFYIEKIRQMKLQRMIRHSPLQLFYSFKYMYTRRHTPGDTSQFLSFHLKKSPVPYLSLTSLVVCLYMYPGGTLRQLGGNSKVLKWCAQFWHNIHAHSRERTHKCYRVSTFSYWGFYYWKYMHTHKHNTNVTQTQGRKKSQKFLGFSGVTARRKYGKTFG
jgi:hypothetical protein